MPVAAGDGLEIPAVTVDDLPAVAPRCAEAHPHAFQHNDRVATFTEFKGGGNAGETAADHADIGFQRALKRRAHGFDIGGGRIP